MTNRLETLDATGHLTLWWDPDVPDTVEAARGEFERLRGLGYGFFATDESDAAEVSALDLEAPGAVSVRRIKEFQPRARRTVAVRPLRGG